MGAPVGRAPTMKAPSGKPPPTATQKTAATASKQKQETPVKAAAASSSAPAAPPVDWFYKWIKKEPFGPNAVAQAPAANEMPEPIAKVEDDGGSDLSLDLAAELQGGSKQNQGDPGDIFNEGPAKPKSLAEQLAEQALKLKSNANSTGD